MNQQQALALGSFVRAARKAKRLSARDLAQPAGIDTAQILRIERGEVAAPRVAVLQGIARRLRIPVSDIFALAGYTSTKRLPSIEPYLQARYPKLTVEQRTQVVGLITLHTTTRVSSQ